MKTCSRCAAENAANANFCNQCGTALNQAAPTRTPYTPPHLLERVLQHRSAIEGERKQVTVLFADLAGSTQLSAQVDAEAWHHVLDRYFSILGEEIHRCEGTINQFTGDGVMALFGAPLALENHAHQAALAALAIQRRMRSFADQLRLEQGLNLATRVGMNSGEVIVGRIGDDLRMDYTAQGLTVNLAARMEQIAQPGCIYITADTAHWLQDYFHLRDLGPMPVKGREAAVEVYELTGQSEISLRLEASRQRGLTPMAGRQKELQQLLDAQNRSIQGQRQILVMLGEAGLGKSRLCHEAVQRWRAAGVSVLSCSGMPPAQSVPLAPVRDLLMQRFGVAPGEGADLARQKIAGAVLLAAPELREQLPVLFEFLNLRDAGQVALPIAPEARDSRNRDLFRKICTLQPDRPRVILIEDLHWMDQGSLEYLRAVLECPEASSTLVLINSRPTGLPIWLEALPLDRLRLQPLDPQAMTDMTVSLLGHAKDMDALAQRIASQAAGNPFYIEETVRALVARGYLAGTPGQYAARNMPQQIDIPASVQAIIASRVDHLPEEQKDLLRHASILGQRFERPLLQAISGASSEIFEALLQRLDLGNFLRAMDGAGSDELAFCHPLLQEVIYTSLLSERRQLMHQQAAAVLEAHFQDQLCLRAAVLLAHHWEAAGSGLKAAHWCIQVALLSATQNPHQQRTHLRRAIALLDAEPQDEGVLEASVRARAGMLRLATFFDVPEDEASACYEKAREIVERSGDRAMLAELLISNGVRRLNHSDADQAMQDTGQAMALAQDLGDQSLEQRFRIPILFSYFAAGRLREGLSVLDRRDAGAWHQGEFDPDNMLSRGFRGLILAVCGQLEAAEQEVRGAIACAERNDVSASWLYANLVDVLIQRGRSAGTLSLAQQAVDRAEAFGSGMFMVLAQRAMAQARLAAGQPQAAWAALQRVEPLVGDGGAVRQFRCAHGIVKAAVLAGLKQPDQALACIEAAVEEGRAVRQRVWLLRALLWQAQALPCEASGQDDRLDEIEQLIQETGAVLFRADLALLRSSRASACGREDEARNWQLEAKAHWQRCGASSRVQQLEAVA